MKHLKQLLLLAAVALPGLAFSAEPAPPSDPAPSTETIQAPRSKMSCRWDRETGRMICLRTRPSM